MLNRMPGLNIRSRNNSRGFTLTELAIVLTAASFIFGAVWIAGDLAWNNYGVYKVTRQVTQVIQNIRDQYSNVQQPTNWITAGNEETLNLDAGNLFPVEMRRNPSLAPGAITQLIDHALYDGHDAFSQANGSFHVFYINAAGAGNMPSVNACKGGAVNPLTGAVCFRIWLYGLDQTPCSRLVRALPLNNQLIGGAGNLSSATNDLGIANVGVVNTTGACTTKACFSNIAVSSQTAIGWCNGTSKDNTVFWDLKLHN